jgi:hypothetical protein
MTTYTFDRLASSPRAVDSLRALCTGPVGTAGGVAVLPQILDPTTFHALASEAHSAYPNSTRQLCDHADETDGRGGTPRRALQTAPGGPVQDALYSSPSLHSLLSNHCGTRISPSGNRGSYSYYVQPNDFLDTHLDIDTCDVTLITVLQDDTDPSNPAGGLAVYPHHFGASLARIRAVPQSGVAVIKAPAGSSVLLLGGLVPHRVEPLPPEGQRIISALCFRAD